MAINVKFRVPNFFKSVKYCLSAINGVFLVSGLFLLTVGIVVVVSYSEYEDLTTQRFFNVSGFTVGTGVVILIVALLGFYGAWSQSFYFIAAYVILLLVVLVFEIAIAIAAYALKNDAASIIRTPMLESLQLYSTRVEVAKLWDDLQQGFECCGVAGRFDYISNQIPVSCCHMDYGTISPFECGTVNAYSTGCAEALGAYLAQQTNVLAISALVATCIQALVIPAAAWMAWRTKFAEVELEQ